MEPLTSANGVVGIIHGEPYSSSDRGERRRLTKPADFLLFIPTNAPGLKAVFSYYQSTSKISAEGDVHMSDEALQGLGTVLAFLNNALFGAVTQLVRPAKRPLMEHHNADGTEPTTPVSMWEGSESRPQLHLPDDEDNSIDDDPYIPLKPARRKEGTSVAPGMTTDAQQLQTKGKKDVKLIDFVPHVGYFLAGGLSGITSRTLTAPLDRLKVYLIAQTGTADEAVHAVKKGRALAATKHGARTLMLAWNELWAAGGVRSLFAGKFVVCTKERRVLIGMIGNGLNVLKVMPESSVKFGAYEVSIAVPLPTHIPHANEGDNRPQNVSLPDWRATTIQNASSPRRCSSLAAWPAWWLRPPSILSTHSSSRCNVRRLQAARPGIVSSCPRQQNCGATAASRLFTVVFLWG